MISVRNGEALRDSEQSNPTRQDLKQVGFAVLLFELVILGLALAARGFLGSRTAFWVGLGLGALVLAAFALITAVTWLGHSIGDHRRRRRHLD